MNVVDFVNKVREMRTAQKTYFKTRLQGDLIKSKQFEAEVDKALKEGVTMFEMHTLTDAGEQEYQLGFEEPLDAADLLDTSAEQRPTDRKGANDETKRS